MFRNLIIQMVTLGTISFIALQANAGKELSCRGEEGGENAYTQLAISLKPVNEANQQGIPLFANGLIIHQFAHAEIDCIGTIESGMACIGRWLGGEKEIVWAKIQRHSADAPITATFDVAPYELKNQSIPCVIQEVKTL